MHIPLYNGDVRDYLEQMRKISQKRQTQLLDSVNDECECVIESYWYTLLITELITFSASEQYGNNTPFYQSYINCPEPRISQFNWHKKTNRVSVTWCLNVSDQISIAKWCLLALPHDERKRLKMLEWVSRKPDVVAEARRQLIRDGLLTK